MFGRLRARCVGMAMSRSARRPEGVVVRHAKGCASGEGEGCDCRPGYQAQVWSPRDAKTIRRTFRTLADARTPCRCLKYIQCDLPEGSGDDVSAPEAPHPASSTDTATTDATSTPALISVRVERDAAITRSYALAATARFRSRRTTSGSDGRGQSRSGGVRSQISERPRPPREPRTTSKTHDPHASSDPKPISRVS
jgi:hypothetical protein